MQVCCAGVAPLSCIFVPLLEPQADGSASSGHALGVLQCTTSGSSEQPLFSDADIMTVRLLAAQACAAVGKARRFDAAYRRGVQVRCRCCRCRSQQAEPGREQRLLPVSPP